jgi:phage/plasmid-like protein (TIGR03299 family)
MSANLNEVNGKVAFMSAVQPAWHGKGQILDKAATSAEAIEAANLDFDVAMQPVFTSISSAEGDSINIEIPNRYATYRTDTNDVFGVVGSRYEIVQNKEAFSFFDAIVGEGAAIYETAGALGNGETVFISAKMPDHIRIDGNDIIENYVFLNMNHAGKGAIQAMITPVRPVCANTVALALKNCTHKISIRHTKSAKEQLEQAHKIMGISNMLTDSLSDMFSTMASKSIKDSIAYNYFDKCFLSKEQLTALAKGELRTDILSNSKQELLSGVKEFYFTGVGQDMKTAKGTVWGAYNAVTGYLQNVKEYKNEDAKLKSLILGSDYDVSATALNLALQLT